MFMLQFLEHCFFSRCPLHRHAANAPQASDEKNNHEYLQQSVVEILYDYLYMQR